MPRPALKLVTASRQGWRFLPLRRLRDQSILSLVLLTAGVFSGCDQSFEPFRDSEFALSIMGYLDASADTQWVRVTPIRRTIFTPRDPIGADVTIQRIDQSATTRLKESIFSYESVFIEMDDPQLATTYWTDQPLSYGSSYRVTVTPPGGPTAVTTVAIPADYPVMVRNQPSGVFARVEMEHLALVQVHCDLGMDGTLKVPFTLSPPEDGVHSTFVTRQLTRDLSCPPRNTTIQVVVSGAPWPHSAALSSSSLLMLERPSGITNAVGFMGGVVSKLVPWEVCTWAVPPLGQPPCDLRFDHNSIHLDGFVYDTACGGVASIEESEVRLTEIPPVAGRRARVWTAAGDPEGYKLDLLEEGRYEARISSPLHVPRNVDRDSPAAMRIFGVVIDTLTFRAGERARRDFVLPRLQPCGV